MKKRNPALKPYLAAGLLAMGLSTVSYAQTNEAGDEKFRLAGFASIVYAKTLNNDADDIHGGNGPNGDFPNEETGEYRNFNKFGLRLDVDLDDNLTFVAQMLAEGDNDYEPEFDWIAATYSVTPNLSITVGKTVAPLFMYSDYLDTSYAYQWISAPYAVYGAGIAKTTEGARINWKADMGGAWSSDLTVWNGSTNETLSELGGSNLIIDGGTGIAWEVEREWLTLRGVYFKGKTSADVSGFVSDYVTLVQAVTNANFGAAGTVDLTTLNTYQEDLLWEEEDSEFFGFGLGLDFDTVFFNAEGTVVEAEENIAIDRLESWYAMIGTRIPGNVTLSLTYSEDTDKVNEDAAENFYDEIIDSYQGTLGAPTATALAELIVNTGTVLPSPPFPTDYMPSINQLYQYQQSNSTENLTFTARWDFHKAASVKFEYYTAEITQFSIATNDEFTQKPKGFAVGIDLVF